MKKKLPKKKDGTEGKQVRTIMASSNEENNYCFMNDIIICCKQPEVTSTGVKFPENKGAGVFLRSARVSTGNITSTLSVCLFFTENKKNPFFLFR